jgi:hypothetical protein
MEYRAPGALDLSHPSSHPPSGAPGFITLAASDLIRSTRHNIHMSKVGTSKVGKISLLGTL